MNLQIIAKMSKLFESGFVQIVIILIVIELLSHRLLIQPVTTYILYKLAHLSFFGLKGQKLSHVL